MKWIPDKTGRFRQRPYYAEEDLEQICEEEIMTFLRERHGNVTFPVSTSDLTLLLEQHVADLDNGCDLPDGNDGYTDFFPRRKPEMKIANRLQQQYLENRLRTTLTHEHGHVHLHGYLFQLDDGLAQLFSGAAEQVQTRCKRETIEQRARIALNATVTAFREQHNLLGDIGTRSPLGRSLIIEVMRDFHVSQDAATYRLRERKLLVDNPSRTLFA